MYKLDMELKWKYINRIWNKREQVSNVYSDRVLDQNQLWKTDLENVCPTQSDN